MRAFLRLSPAFCAVFALVHCEPAEESASPAASPAVHAAATTCDARLEAYPVNGPHNGGYDSNALNYTCPPHPNHSRDNSDYLGSGADEHRGNDIFAARGTPLVAPRTGTIVRLGHNPVGGNRVTIRDSCGWYYYLAHMDQIASDLQAGMQIQAGRYLGTVGNTGNASGTSPHLHFSIFPDNNYGAGIDPFPLLQAVDAGACGGQACTPSCDGHVIVDAQCGRGDCAAFGSTCIIQDGAPTCAAQGCTPRCDGAVAVASDCTRGDCGAFGVSCAMQNGVPTCTEPTCGPRCDGNVIVAADCSRGDCGAFGAACAMVNGTPECVTDTCTPACEGDNIVGANCVRDSCAAFGQTCVYGNNGPECGAAGCTPACDGSVIVDAQCGRGDCGAFGANCVIRDGAPTCELPCTPQCEGDVIVDGVCGRGDCAAFGSTCVMNGTTPECQVGCTPHCEGDVIVGANCVRDSCAPFGQTCVVNGSGPECGAPTCTHRCDGDEIVASDCTRGNCAAFGLTCVNYGNGPECGASTCTPRCDGAEIVGSDCSRGNCGAFGMTCSTITTGDPHCVLADCLGGAGGAPTPGASFCVAGERVTCDANGAIINNPCPSGQSCNACGGCGAVPTEVCNYRDDDCDGGIDEGVRNICGGCGAVPMETCNFADDDCDGDIDEGVRNACGGCGAVAAETCNFADDNCNGQVDEGVRNACNTCGPVPAEQCNGADDDCDAETDEGFAGLGDACTVGQGPCQRTGVLICTGDGTGTMCSVVAAEATQERCNGEDDDCDGDVDEDFALGEVCAAGTGACAGAGVLACDPRNAMQATCLATEIDCNDNDDCTIDGCDPMAGCINVATPTCCSADTDCPTGTQCDTGQCVATLCARCETDIDCRQADARCLPYGSSSACAVPCGAGCPEGFECTPPIEAGGVARCVVDGSVCACPAPDGTTICIDGNELSVDGCGTPVAMVGSCDGPIADPEPHVDTNATTGEPDTAEPDTSEPDSLGLNPTSENGEGSGQRANSCAVGTSGQGWLLVMLLGWIAWRRRQLAAPTT
ncbi:MAG: hypothetical protein ACI9MR_002783 [Myxococcota bacterium]|jgi:hypothetical protein